MERRTLVESLMISGEIEVKTSKVYWKSIIIFLTFSLNPFLMALSKAINLSGMIPFSVLIIFISLLFYYLNSVILNACTLSRATTYSELFNNYFHRMDRIVNLAVFLYGFFYICLVQVAVLITILASYREIFGYDSQISLYVLIPLLCVFSFCMILLSWSQELKEYYKACIVSLILLIFTVLGGSVVIATHRENVSALIDCENYYFNGDFYLSVYILLVVVNIFQSLTLIYKDIRDSNLVLKRELYEQALKIALIITVCFYLLFGFMMSFTERITSSRSPGPEEFNLMFVLLCIFRLFKFTWFILQVCLMMLTLKSSFLSIFSSSDYEISSRMSLLLSAIFIFLSNAAIYYVYTRPSDQRTYQRYGGIGCYSNEAYDEDFDFNEDDDYDPQPYEDLNLMYYAGHQLFMVNAYFSIIVGLIIPWGLMIRTTNYSQAKIAIVAVGILIVLVLVVYSSFYEKNEFYFPV